MHAASASSWSFTAAQGQTRHEPEVPLAKLVYRSRAVKSLSPAELHELTRSSQARNSRESITGLMLHDNDQFFQWLEGPEDSVGRLMDSIRNDSRHTDIEVLDVHSVPDRTFGGWDMKLATQGPVMASWRREVIEPSAEIVEDLRRRPEQASDVLVRLVPVAPEMLDLVREVSLAEAGGAPLHRKTAMVLKDLFVAAVLPQLSKTADGRSRQADLKVAELADLLVAQDQAASHQLIRELHEAECAIGPVIAALLEPAARRLGDLWAEDFCSEFDVTLGLSRIQSAVRLLGAAPVQAASHLARPVVLIAPEPGELHRLGAVLDSTILRAAGWSPHCEYPTNDGALQDLLGTTWIDVLDMSLSIAMRHEHRLPRVSETIADARRASRNPGLLVVIGGRVFHDDEACAFDVGADLASTTAVDVDRLILRTLSETRVVTATPA